MRDLHDGGMSYRALAKKYGVCRSTVQGICNYRRRSTTVVRVIRRR